MFLRTPQLIRPVMVWYEVKGQKPLILVHEIKKQAFRPGETTFFCISTCYVMMKLAQPARRPRNRPGFPHAMSRWSWHSLPDDLATDLDLHRTSKYNQRQTFIQVNDVETRKSDRTSVSIVSGMMATNLQERSMTYQLKVPENLQERSMTYQLKSTRELTGA